jgi:ubiquinone/menaquinone biosynthesis C-methylase UbiE
MVGLGAAMMARPMRLLLVATCNAMDECRLARATSFGAWADEYDASRPSYPDAAVKWLVGDAHRVIEVGAGTGKLTDRLVDLNGVQVSATEIDGRMLRLIGLRHPSLQVHEAGVTELPIADGSVDAVLVADAWHWFPAEEAAAEVGRVLRCGGWLGCVWNDMAATTPDWQWEALKLSADIADQVRAIAPIDRLGLTTGHADQATFRWSWRLTPRQFGDYVGTVSHVRTLPHLECQAAIAAAVRLARAACDAATSTVAVEFEALCIRWRA